jgi:hypothetical protein
MNGGVAETSAHLCALALARRLDSAINVALYLPRRAPNSPRENVELFGQPNAQLWTRSAAESVAKAVLDRRPVVALGMEAKLQAEYVYAHRELDRLRREAGQPPADERLVFDDATQTVRLDGRAFGPIDVCAYRAYKAIAGAGGAVVKLDTVPGLPRKEYHKVLRKLPGPLLSTVKSRRGSGRWLQLTPRGISR